MTTKHTPGPWFVFEHGNCRPGIDAAGASVVLWCDKDEEEAGFVDDGGVRGRTEDEARANAFLIAAAPDLLAAQTMGAEVNTPDFLDWIADRLVHVYAESPSVDFVRSLRDRAEVGRAAIARAIRMKS